MLLPTRRSLTSLKQLQQTWEHLAQTDPLWSVCSDGEKRGGKWLTAEFFATGKTEIGVVLRRLESLGLRPPRTTRALDFGCGVGRLTVALAEHFDDCCGVDISPTMITKAREYHADNPLCRFVLNEAPNLRQFADGDFGLIYSSIVLQHMEPVLTKGYLAEFARVLTPGGVLVFQVADEWRAGLIRRLRGKLALRRRIARLLHPGNSAQHPLFEMHCVPEQKVRDVLAGCGLLVMDVALTNSTEPAFNGNLRYLDAEPRHGFVSKQYVAVKN